MKSFTRFGAVLSFLFCFVAGICVLIPASEGSRSEGYFLAAIGLFFIGIGCFFGSMLWLKGEKHSLDVERR